MGRYLRGAGLRTCGEINVISGGQSGNSTSNSDDKADRPCVDCMEPRNVLEYSLGCMLGMKYHYRLDRLEEKYVSKDSYKQKQQLPQSDTDALNKFMLQHMKHEQLTSKSNIGRA